MNIYATLYLKPGDDSGSPLYTFPSTQEASLLGHLVRATDCYRIRIDGENNHWFNVTVIGPYEEGESCNVI